MAKASKLGPAAIFAAKLVFLGAGYVGIAVLSRALTTEQFGTYSVVMGAVALINMVLINGTMQTVARFVAAHPEAQAGVRRRAFLYQAVFASVVVGGVLLGAPLIADFLNDDSVTPLIRLAMAITGIYAFYAINVGYLNGRKFFVRQASLDVFFSIVKWSSMITLAYLGYEVEGVIGGFALAALLVFLLSFVLVGKTGKSEAPPISPLGFAGFAFSVMGVALLLNAMLQADLFLLKRLTEAAASDTAAGLYGAAQQVARIPYYLMATASLVLFPMVASLRTHDELGRARAADAVTQAWTAVFGLVAGMALVTVPISGRVLSVLYPDKYLPAADALQWLITALVVLTMVNISVTMISGAGKPRVSVLILVVGLVTQAGAAHLLIPLYGLSGAAMSTVGAGALCLALATGYLARYEGLRIPLRVPVVVGLAGALTWALATGFDQVAPDSRILTLLFCAVAYPLYLGVLLVGGVLLGARANHDRVLLVTKPIAPPFNDGSKVLAKGLLDAMDPLKLAVLSTKSGKKELAAHYEGLEAVPVYGGAATFRSGGLVNNLRVFLFLLSSRFNYRALHFFFAPNPTTCRAIRLIKLLSPGVRFVQTVQSRPRSYEGASDLLFGDLVTAHSEDTVQKLHEATGREIELVRPGIPALSEVTDRDAALRARELDPEETHLLFAGDLDEGGALAHLEVLVPKILDGHDKARFHLSVRRKHEDTEAKARALVDGPLGSYADRVSVWVDDEDFRGLLDLQDAMLFPQDDLIAKVDAPLVILETLQRGRPVFLLQRPALDELGPEALRDQLSADTAEALADRVLDWLRDPGSIDPKALQDDVTARFSSISSAERYGALHG